MKRSSGNKSKFSIWMVAAIVSLTAGCIALAQEPPAAGNGTEPIAAEDVSACQVCHEQDVSFSIKGVSKEKLDASPHKGMTCQDCHSSIDGAPHTASMLETKVTCVDCHSDANDVFMTSAHAKPDKQAGDHPTCVTCHGDGDAHAVTTRAQWTAAEKARMCSECHRQAERMQRYDVDTDAVSSYEESYHGKALLKFDSNTTATCIDCHGAHTMTDPTDPKSNVGRDNAEKICSKPECHPGAKENFAMSGANHMRLKMKESPVLLGIYYFFRILTFGMLAFMLGGVGLDLRSKVFGPKRPKSGRLVGFTISVSYILVIAALVCGMFGLAEIASTLGIVSLALLVSAYVGYFIRKKHNGNGHGEGRMYRRFDLNHRLQHVLLMLSFTTLIITGMPMRFFNIDWLSAIYIPFGGLEGARVFHRAAGIALIVVFLWHTTELFIRWAKTGFSLRSFTMLPNRKDLHDFVTLSKSYLGMSHEEPRYDRFQFKQKMDYMAEYWGVPLMVVTGFMQWYPTYWGNNMPEIGLSAAVVAHSWEATLAFVAIITWHIYNEHFNPDAFPMSKVWITGNLSEEEMRREHPLELERIVAAESATTTVEAEPSAEVPVEAPADVESEVTPEASPEETPEEQDPPQA